MSARRSLLTASAAGALLGALWFVPSANATGHESPANRSTESTQPQQHRGPSTTTTTTTATTTTTTASSSSEDRLADTGAGVDTTPYVIGGTAFLALGAGFVAYSVRREQRGDLAF
ncbi:hypothetical protein ACIBKX_21235 [Streptomyces sp. NPDC050658]|uniref:hypothetical protein n=1 Tax=unclassified Streptomyces TaxID=2593676 RepID=UPI0034364F44